MLLEEILKKILFKILGNCLFYFIDNKYCSIIIYLQKVEPFNTK